MTYEGHNPKRATVLLSNKLINNWKREKRTTPPQNNEEEEDRNIRTKEEVNRIIRDQHPKTPKPQTHMKKGECDIRRSQPKKSNIVVVKQTHKQLT